MKPKISMIVCTYNREKLLARLLDSILAQDVGTRDMELIVVDNNSSDGTRSVAEAYSRKIPGLRYVFEGAQGLSHARNRGSSEAEGEYLTYIDDDAQLPSHYLRKLSAALAEHSPDILGGPVYPSYSAEKPKWFRDKYEVRQYADKSGFLESCRASGGNLTIRKELLSSLGGFDVNLGMIGGQVRLGEERSLLEAYVRKTPLERRRSYYDLDCYILHDVPAHKMRLRYIFGRHFQAGRSAARAKKREPFQAIKFSFVLVPWLMRDIWKAVRAEGVHRADYLAAVAFSASVVGNIIELSAKGPWPIVRPIPGLLLRKTWRGGLMAGRFVAKILNAVRGADRLQPETAAVLNDAVRLIGRFLGGLGVNRALKDQNEMEGATRLVQLLGLPSHHDAQKNWDTFRTLALFLSATRPDSAVLDAGSGGKSAILRWLTLLGYKNLHACDIRQGGNPFPSVRFQVQDLTKTNYPSASFDAISCISVIEHGVPLDLFVAEMWRLLRPGGVLAVSTDYWSEPIDCRGIYPYGQAMGEMKVLQPEDIQRLCTLAAAKGLELCGPLDLSTSEKAVRWERVGRNYTFFFAAFRKRGTGEPARGSAGASSTLARV